MSGAHKDPVDGATCMCCWDDMDSSNYVEYQGSENSEWLASGFCQMCIEHLLTSQWELYTNALKTTTCKAEQRRLLKCGPPINLKDVKALPCPEDGEVHKLWYMSNGEEKSAKLHGSLIGEAREKFWKDQAEFFAENEPDDDDDEENNKSQSKPAVHQNNGTPNGGNSPAPNPVSPVVLSHSKTATATGLSP